MIPQQLLQKGNEKHSISLLISAVDLKCFHLSPIDQEFNRTKMGDSWMRGVIIC